MRNDSLNYTLPSNIFTHSPNNIGAPPEGFLLLTLDPEEESSVSAATSSLTFDNTEGFGFLLLVWSAEESATEGMESICSGF